MGIFTNLAMIRVMSRSSYGFGCGLGFGLGFGGFHSPAYNAFNPSTSYLSTCYCDLDQPTGLSSWVDGGRSINWPYKTSGSINCCGGFGGFGFGGWYC